MRRSIVAAFFCGLMVAGFSAGAGTLTQKGLITAIYYQNGDYDNIEYYTYSFSQNNWIYNSQDGWQRHTTSGVRSGGWKSTNGTYVANVIYYTNDGYNALLYDYAYTNYISCVYCP